MRTKVRVTIGLPVFNAGRYLAYALDSCLAQTYSDFEVIISDNGSTDGTEGICRQYATRDRRIRYYRNQRNLGMAPNFNRVFRLADSEYFKWIPYDDAIAPEFVARCVEVLDSHPAHVLCYSRAIIIDENGREVVDYDPGPATDSPRPEARFRNLILHPEYAIQQMGLIRSEVLRRTGLQGLYPSSDEILLGELALLGPFYEIPARLYYYRRHSEQSTKQPKRRDRATLFDSSLEGSIVLPTWRYLGGLARATRGKALPFPVRRSCALSVLRWASQAPHLRALGMDLALAARRAVMRVRQERAAAR